MKHPPAWPIAALLFTLPCSYAAHDTSGGGGSSAVATFAGGCFWCMEHVFDEVDGVFETLSGYTGGHKVNPTYKEVSSGRTGHTEALRVTYDPKRISYKQLLEVYWRNVDPTVNDRQFCDHGSQYRPEIFYHTPEQKRLAEASKLVLGRTKPFKESIVVAITEAPQFYPAEGYHQDYHHKNPIRYNYYYYRCGRAQRLEQLWGKAS